MLRKMIQNDLKKIQKMKNQVTESIKDAPKGRIRCGMAQGKYPRYYFFRENEREKNAVGRYLHKEEWGLAEKLAQKEYDRKILKIIESQEQMMQTFLSAYKPEALRAVYESLPEAKKRLVSPYEMTDEEFLEQWKLKHSGNRNSYPFFNSFLTENQEEVRSKSEKMIADKFFYEGVIYLYEAPLFLADGELVYPDFTVLNRSSRDTFYMEHFGMMDNPDYCQKALEKIDLYERNGIFLGDNLLVTMESSQKALDMRQVDSLIERFLK